MSQSKTAQKLHFTNRLGASLLMSGACLAAFAAPSFAQDSVAEEEEIVVTGTSIRGAQPVGVVVQSMSAAELAQDGRGTLGDILRELPVNFAGGIGTSDNRQGGQDNASRGSNLTGGQGANLRGLGALSTLVLINGRRAPAAGQFGDFVDISNIPSNAIERVEILQDGASAIYGSDAVAGVVNIILRRDFDGLQTQARVGTTTDGGATEYELSGIYGADWGAGGNFVIGYEYNHQDRLQASDRDVFNGGDFTPNGGVNWRRFAGRAGTAANIFSGSASGDGTVIYSVPNGANTALTAGDLTVVTDGVGNTYDLFSNLDILPEMERHSVFASFDRSFGGADVYGDIRYTRRDGNYNTGYGVLYDTLPSTSPFYIPGIGANAFGVVIDDRGLTREVSVDSVGGELGVRWDLGRDWAADATISYAHERSSRDETLIRDANIFDRLSPSAFAPNSTTCALSGLNSSSPGPLTAAQAYCAALNYTPFNPYSTEPISDAVLDEIIGFENLTYNSWIAQASLKIDGTLFELPAGGVRAALGVDLRRENMDGELDFNYRSIDAEHVPYGETERDIGAIFAELAVPITERLDLSLAVRSEGTTGQGGGYTSTDPKVGLNWEPVDGLNFHGSWGTSFHAPPMRFTYTGPQPVSGGNAAFVLPRSYFAPCNTSLVALNGIIGTPGGSGSCSFTILIVSGGAGDLDPESAETFTAGFDFEPRFLPGLRIGVSYFDLEVEDRIVRIQGGTLPSILASYFATGDSPYISNLNFSPTLAEATALFNDPRFLGQLGPPAAIQTPANVAAIVYATQTNLASLHENGVDFYANYAVDLGEGELEFFVNGTYINAYEVQAAAGSPFVDQLDQYNSVGNPLSLRTRQGISYANGPFSARATVNYQPDYECRSGCFVADPSTGEPVPNTSPVPIDSWTTLDLALSYDFEGANSMANGLSIGLNVINATNEPPPFVNGGTSVDDDLPDPYDGSNATINGRSVFVTLTKRW